MTKTISPENAFLVMGVIFGMLFVFVTPPFQVPDEPQHFHRAYHLSELRFFDAVYLGEYGGRGSSWLGALLPKSLASLEAGADLVTTRFRPYSKLITSKILSTLKIPLNPDEREYLPIAPYPPAGHIPQAIGIAIGRTLRQPPLVQFYLGRICALAAWLSLMFLAIKTTPVLKWTFFLLALMPMTLYLAASNSADGFVISLTFLMTATLLKWVYDDTKESVRGSDLAWLTLMAIAIAWSKVIYLPVIALFLLIPRHKFKNQMEYYGSLVCIIAIALAAYSMWGLIIEHTTASPALQSSRYGIDPPPFSKISSNNQMELISSNPATLARVLANTASDGGVFILYSFVGLLGWVDILLPLWLPFLYVPALVAASLLNVSNRQVNAGARLFSASIFGATVLVSLLMIYIYANPVGARMVTGYQGRYLIPVAPTLFLLFHGNLRKTSRANGIAIVMLLCVVVTTASVAAHCVFGRFYSGAGVAYHIDDVLMSPNQDSVTVTGWAVDRQPADRAAGLDITVDVFRATVSEASSIGDRATGLDLKSDGPYYPARYGIDRPGVAEATRETSYRYSGFEARVPLSELGDGNYYTLALRITTRDRKSYLVRVFARSVKTYK